MELENKVVVVTGGASGIGAATARLFASQGATVVVTDVNGSLAGEMISASSANEKMSFVKMDVSKFDSVQAGLKQIIETHGQLDVMVCNAGVGVKKFVKTAEHTIDDWEQVIAVNQSGVFYCMKLALQQMVKQGYGNIVNVASLAGLIASGKNLAYSASKFAVVGMTKSAALEYASKNIRINCVCPGYTHSALLDSLFAQGEGMEDRLLQFIPMKRYGQPTEIAEAIYWLASDKSSYVTGHTLTLSGGLSL